MTAYFQAALVGIIVVATLAVAVAAGGIIETQVRGDRFADITPVPETQVAYTAIN